MADQAATATGPIADPLAEAERLIEASERAGIVFVRSDRAAEIQHQLRAERIYCGSFLGGIRCDPSFYNTTADIDRLLHVLARHR